jgi:sulfatase modifying factor 1
MSSSVRGGWGRRAFLMTAVVVSGLLVVNCGGESDEDERDCILACSNHGTCEWRDGERTCECDTGYAGDRCGSCADGYERGAEGDCVEDSAAGSDGTATCIPDCVGKECGDDGCGSPCGPECPSSQTCSAGQCQDLVYGPEGQSCSGMTGTECNGGSCCTSIVLPAGSFLMGRSAETCSGCTDGCPSGMSCDTDEQPEHPASVSSFALDKYEVTVGRFRAFVDAFEGGWRPSEGEGANPAVESAQGLISGPTGWQSAWDSELPTDGTALEFWISTLATCTWTSSARASETYPINCVNW